MLSFGLPTPNHVDLGVYDLAGRKLADIAKGEFAAGSYTRRWDGRDAAGNVARSGMYFFKLRVGNETRLVRSVRLN
jgi:hypothetical protein